MSEYENKKPDELKANEYKKKDLYKGFGLIILLHLIWIVIPPAFFAIGLVQFFYVIPAALFYSSKGRTGMVQGILIAAGITFLLNAACFGYIFVAFR